MKSTLQFWFAKNKLGFPLTTQQMRFQQNSLWAICVVAALMFLAVPVYLNSGAAGHPLDFLFALVAACIFVIVYCLVGTFSGWAMDGRSLPSHAYCRHISWWCEKQPALRSHVAAINRQGRSITVRDYDFLHTQDSFLSAAGERKRAGEDRETLRRIYADLHSIT